MNKNSKTRIENDQKKVHISDETNGLLLDSIIPYQINRLCYRMNRLLNQELKTQGLSISNWRVMAALDFDSSITVNELADYAMIEQSTLSRMLQRMEANGLVEVKHASTDARMRVIFLTALGRERFHAVRDVTLRHVKRVIHGLSEGEQIQLIRFISRMQANLEFIDI